MGGSNSLIATSLAGGDVINGALVSNIATVDVRNTSGNTATLDASTITALTAVNSYLGTGNVSVSNLAAGGSLGIIGNSTVVNGGITAGYVDAATAATINISGGTTGGAVEADGLGLTSATVNSTGAANTLKGLLYGLTLSNSVTGLTINAATNLTTNGVNDTGLKTIAVSDGTTGAATSVNLGVVNSPVLSSVDASGLTAGGLTISASSLTSFKGGAGNDALSLTGPDSIATAGLTLDGGAGTNSLGIANTTLIAADYAGINAATNFQTLIFEGSGATVDQGQITNSTISGLTFDPTGGAVAGAVVVNNALTATEYSIVGATSVGLTAKLGQVALNASLDGTSGLPATAGSGISVANATTLNLASNGKLATGVFAQDANQAGNVSLLDNWVLNITGSQDLQLTVVDSGAGPSGLVGESVNAASFTGELQITGSGFAAINDITTGAGKAEISGLGYYVNPVTGVYSGDNLTLGYRCRRSGLRGRHQPVGCQCRHQPHYK